MSKVLVSGLGIGNELGFCQACSLDFTWLAKEPSTIMWADKILLPRKTTDSILQRSDTKTSKAVKIALELFKDYDVIEYYDTQSVLGSNFSDGIQEIVNEEIAALLTKFPENIKLEKEDADEHIVINDLFYCSPYVGSMYASIKLADFLGAKCLFGYREYNYLKFKYGLGGLNTVETINELFSLYFPNEFVNHNYAFTDEDKCNTCRKIDNCKDRFLLDYERDLQTLLKWRNYDEIKQALGTIESIILEIEFAGKTINPNEVKRAFEDKIDRINKGIHKIFPQIKKWAGYIGLAATPLVIYSATTGNIPLIVTASSIQAASYMASEGINLMENKHRWVSYLKK